MRWRGGAKDRQALVRWAGFDRDSGEAWPLEWVCRKDLTPDLRELGRLRAPPRPKAVIDAERERRALRVAAKAARVELPGRWRGRMRSDGERAPEGATNASSSDSDGAEGSGDASDGAGVKRAGIQGMWGGRLRRRLDLVLLRYRVLLPSCMR